MEQMCRSSFVMTRSALRCSVELVLCFCWCVLWTGFAHDVCNRPQTRQMCGHLKYDANKYTCCNGNITKGSYPACCGTTAFNVMEKTCCNNILTDGLSQVVSNCCGSEAYNRLNQICCGGKIHNRASAQTLCCGSVLYNSSAQLCCGKSHDIPVTKNSDHDKCCGNTSFNSLKQCCSDLVVEDLKSKACKEETMTTPISIPSTSKAAKLSVPPTTMSFYRKRTIDVKTTSQDSAFPDECSKKSKDPSDHVTQCCGSEVHVLSKETELCCDGQLYHNQPPGSTCVGKIAFSPQKYTVCQQEGHRPAGQHCCGDKTFDPDLDICCDGHSHKKSGHSDMVCCGTHAYRLSDKKRCCFGHLHDLTCLNAEETGCCGTLLLTNKKKQRCCHSADYTLIYEAQDRHSCCGHWYYNQSLWSCCAGQLIPEPTNTSTEEAQAVSYKLWLMDLSTSAVCSQTVLLGTVESVAIKQNKRAVVLKHVLEVSFTTTVTADALKIVQLNHCQFPALETGKTYLWKKKDNVQFEPMADVSSLTSPIHTILSLCQSAGSHNAA